VVNKAYQNFFGKRKASGKLKYLKLDI